MAKARIPADARTRALAAVAQDAAGCRRCGLWAHATQTVFGRGPADARVLFVGEQPGDAEDLAGEPFVGPAGRLLTEAIAEAGLGTTPHYVTNAVKHFKWEPRGKRRIHARPRLSEMVACHYWIEQEVAILQPRLVVALGATAARALIGPGVRVSQARGTWMSGALGERILVTVHPASILRTRGSAEREEARRAFVRDLRLVAAQLGKRR